jgi:hypothetical protein
MWRALEVHASADLMNFSPLSGVAGAEQFLFLHLAITKMDDRIIMSITPLCF